MSKRALFFFKASNTLGLYYSFANKLVSEGYEVTFVDESDYLESGYPDQESRVKIQALGYKLEVISKPSTPPSVYDQISFIENLYQDSTIKLVVVPYEAHFHYFLVNIAKLNKITTVHIQHGLWGPGKFLPGYNRLDYQDTPLAQEKAATEALLAQQDAVIERLTRKLKELKQRQKNRYNLIGRFFKKVKKLKQACLKNEGNTTKNNKTLRNEENRPKNNSALMDEKIKQSFDAKVYSVYKRYIENKRNIVFRKKTHIHSEWITI